MEEKQTVEPAQAPAAPVHKNLAEQTMEAVEAQKIQNDRAEKILKEQRELYSVQQLGGKSDSGQVPVEPKVATPEEYAKEVLAGKYNVKATKED